MSAVSAARCQCGRAVPRAHRQLNIQRNDLVMLLNHFTRACPGRRSAQQTANYRSSARRAGCPTEQHGERASISYEKHGEHGVSFVKNEGNTSPLRGRCSRSGCPSRRNGVKGLASRRTRLWRVKRRPRFLRTEALASVAHVCTLANRLSFLSCRPAFPTCRRTRSPSATRACSCRRACCRHAR